MTHDDGTPTRCPNGHDLPSGQAFCGACGSPAEHPSATSGKPGTAGTGKPARTRWFAALPRNAWLLSGIAMAAILVAIIAISVSSSRHDGGPDRAGTDSDTADTPTTPEEKCMSVVMDFLSQVPDAISEGYEDGVDATPIYTEYGMNSRVGQSILGLQPTLIANIMADGNPVGQLEAIKSQVHENCYDEFNYFHGGGLQGLE